MTMGLVQQFSVNSMIHSVDKGGLMTYSDNMQKLATRAQEFLSHLGLKYGLNIQEMQGTDSTLEFDGTGVGVIVLDDGFAAYQERVVYGCRMRWDGSGEPDEGELEIIGGVWKGPDDALIEAIKRLVAVELGRLVEDEAAVREHEERESLREMFV